MTQESHLKLRNRLLRNDLRLQNTSQNLPTGRLWYNVQNPNTTLQPLVSRLMLLNMLMNCFHDIGIRNTLCFFALDDKGQGYFSCALVHNANYCAVGNVGMVEKMGLQFRWRNLMALQ